MIAEKKIVKEFLKNYEMTAEGIDFLENVDTLVNEMEKGLAGEESSLKMLPTYISLDQKADKSKSVIVIDAGGTNFRVALMHFDSNGNPIVDEFTNHKMPGTSGEISKDQFFDEMASFVKPVIDKSDNIGFCFSYPMNSNENKDAQIIYFTKEVRVKDASGEFVGKNLLKALGVHDKNIVLLNDTVAALLGGVASFPDRNFSSFIGFILGTGTNTAYIEKNSNIKKDSKISATKGSMIINMESGNYNKMKRGEIDKILDSKSINPGTQWLEKMVSGAYQGQLVLETLKVAMRDKLFSNNFGIASLEKLDTKHMNNFLRFQSDTSNPLVKICVDDTDKVLVYYIIEEIMERASKLAAINLAAAVIKSGNGGNPLNPVCILAEGSTYFKARSIKERIHFYLKEYMNDKLGLYADVLGADDSILVGSSFAGLL